jgi:cytoskeleton protein RodZ
MESAGARLKKIRQELGISLEEAHKKTKIHLNILKAIEGDSVSGLNPIYLKGFLKIYCKFLGQDPKDYIAEYKIAEPAVVSPVELKGVSEKPRRYAAFLKNAAQKLHYFRPSKKLKAALIYILIIGLVSFGLFNLGKSISLRRKKHLTRKKASGIMPVKTESNKRQKLQPQKATVPVTTPDVTSTAANTLTNPKDAHTGIGLIIRARENCWISLKVDGRVVFQRVLEKGRSENWQAKERIELSLGNAGVVELEANGQLFSNLGRRGQALKNIVITKEGLKVGR